MKIWTSKPQPESEPAASQDFGHRTWRNTLHVGLSYIRYELELSVNGGEYRPLPCGYKVANFTRHFDLGYHMVQYDGYHHCFSLGFLHLCWENHHEDYLFLRFFPSPFTESDDPDED